jgi:uncharacterized protein with von Willebrand factor type A (vWA) domain
LPRCASSRGTNRVLEGEENPLATCSERKTELRKRQKRRMQVTRLKKRMAKATKSEKVEIARKLREMTPGAEVLITAWGLAEVDR